MNVNKDTPSTWRPYKKEMCRNCRATCCTMPAEIELEDLVRLGFVTDDEFENSPRTVVQNLIKQKIIKSYRQKTGLFMLSQKANNDCIFLDSTTRLCTVYAIRPQMCRDFPTLKSRRQNHCPYVKK